MNSFKYPLLPEGEKYVAGYIDLNKCLSRSLDVGGCTLFICKKGSADLSINFKRCRLRPGQVVVVFSSDMILIPIRVSEDFKLFHFSVSINMIDEVLYKSSPDLYEFLYYNPILSPTIEERKLLNGWEQQILWMLRPENSANAYKLISNSLHNFFLALESIASNRLMLSESDYKKSRTWSLLNKFTNLILEHGYMHKDVNFYADKLCITPYYLYKIVRKETQISPKEMIDYFIIAEVKMLLSTTHLSVNEIAETLHFEDPSYLNRFFRRHVGMSLTEFRTNHS